MMWDLISLQLLFYCPVQSMQPKRRESNHRKHQDKTCCEPESTVMDLSLESKPPKNDQHSQGKEHLYEGTVLDKLCCTLGLDGPMQSAQSILHRLAVTWHLILIPIGIQNSHDVFEITRIAVGRAYASTIDDLRMIVALGTDEGNDSMRCIHGVYGWSQDKFVMTQKSPEGTFNPLFQREQIVTCRQCLRGLHFPRTTKPHNTIEHEASWLILEKLAAGFRWTVKHPYNNNSMPPKAKNPRKISEGSLHPKNGTQSHSDPKAAKNSSKSIIPV